MNLEKIYPQLVMLLQLETVHLAESRIVFHFQIQVGKTGAETPLCTLQYADETIGQAYEAVGWSFPVATLEDCKSFTIHDQGWEIFRCDLFPPNYANIQLIKSKYLNYLPNYQDWVRDTDGGWNRGVTVEEYAALTGIDVRSWNECFDRDTRTWFNREKSPLWKKTRVVQKLIRDTASTGQEDVIYVSLRGAQRLQKRRAAVKGEEQRRVQRHT